MDGAKFIECSELPQNSNESKGLTRNALNASKLLQPLQNHTTHVHQAFALQAGTNELLETIISQNNETIRLLNHLVTMNKH